MSVTLRDVTAENYRDVTELRVGPGQERQVAPNADSLLQANYGLGGALAHLELVPLAIYADPTPVGFVMYNATPEHDRFAIMRLMVDARHQRGGSGRAAMTLLLDRFLAAPQATEVVIGHQPGNDAAHRLYRSRGFVDLGPDEDGELLMWRTLNPQPHAWTSIWNPAWVDRQ